MRKPMIGVVPLYDEQKESYWMLPGYMDAIEAAGGLSMMLPLTNDEKLLEEIADRFDGLLFTGGPDVAPDMYGEQPIASCGPACAERDAMESKLFGNFLFRDKPMFGICRGLQIFNVLLGGTLYQDIPTQFMAKTNVPHRQQPPYDQPIHRVKIAEGSLLFSVLKKRNIEVNSYHHQGIRELAPSLIAMARAEDGLIEAVRLPGKKLVFAVQWHPEYSHLTDADSRALFAYFVRACAI